MIDDMIDSSDLMEDGRLRNRGNRTVFAFGNR